MRRAGEGGWIETSAQQARGKAKKALANSPGNQQHHSNGQQEPMGSAVEAAHAKARQRLLQEQLRRKAVGIAFSSSSVGQGQGQGQGAPAGIKSALKSSHSSSSQKTQNNNYTAGNKALSSSAASTPHSATAGGGIGFKDNHATLSSPIESPSNSTHRPVLGGMAGAWAGVVAGGAGGGLSGSNPLLSSPSPTSVSNIDGVVASPSNHQYQHNSVAASSSKGSAHGVSYVASNGGSNGVPAGPSGSVPGASASASASANRSATSFLKNLLFSRSTVAASAPAAAATTPTSSRGKKRRDHPAMAAGSTSATGLSHNGDIERKDLNNAVTYPAEFPDLPSRVPASVNGGGGGGGVSTSNPVIDNHHPTGQPAPVTTNGRLLHSQSESSSQMTHHSTNTDIEDQSRYRPPSIDFITYTYSLSLYLI